MNLKIPKGGNQKSYIEEETTQWQKEKEQKDKQRSTKHTYKTNDRVTRTLLKTGGELRCSGRVSNSCSITNHLSSEAIEQKKIIVYDIGIPGSDFGQAYKCGRIKSFYGTSILCLLIIRSSTAI